MRVGSPQVGAHPAILSGGDGEDHGLLALSALRFAYRGAWVRLPHEVRRQHHRGPGCQEPGLDHDQRNGGFFSEKIAGALKRGAKGKGLSHVLSTDWGAAQFAASLRSTGGMKRASRVMLTSMIRHPVGATWLEHPGFVDQRH